MNRYMAVNRFMAVKASHWLQCAVVLVALGTAGIASAYSPNLATVPWLGNPALPHQVYSGGSLVLQGVATDLDNGAALCISSATWDSGAGPSYNAGTNGYALEATHTYIGAVGQPFTATLTVTLCDTTVLTDTMRVVVRADSQEVRVNMAIDKGLWRLHKRIVRTSSDGLPSGYWRGFSDYYMAATASSVQSFEINNHREGGNSAEDPYVDDVARGLRFILSQSPHGRLQQTGVALVNGNNPDGNANGYGLGVNWRGHASYISGQLIDALVASGTPDKLAETGPLTTVRGRRYADIVQDLLDGYSEGMSYSYGGWWYSFRSFGGNWNRNDTSASHWWAIGVLASEVWGLDAPEWVKDRQWTRGVPLMQRYVPPDNCYFGYTNSQNPIWDSGLNVTAAGLILMNADDVSQTNPRFVCAEGWLSRYWTSVIGNFYSMYQLTKAMRTALDDTGATAPIDTLYDLDYLGNPTGARAKNWYSDFADHLITNQRPDGSFYSTRGTVSSYINSGGDMATSWALIMLAPSLFELPPTAACNASPLIDGTTGIGGSVNFDGSQSAHPDSERTIVSYSWNFADGSPLETGETTSHSFADVGIYNVVLTVEDDNGNTDTDTCQIDVRDNDIPPAARPGGPYQICLGDNLALDGSASSDLDNDIVSYEWDWSSPINFATVDSTAISPTVPAATFSATGIYDIGLQVTDNDGSNGGADHTSQGFTTVNVIPADDPSCNQPPTAFDGGPYTVDEGSTVTLNGSGSDPDGDTLAFAWDLDNDSFFETAGAAPSFDAGLLDDSVVTIWLRVTDPSGLSDEDGTTVTVNNVDPVVEAGGDQTINENDSITLAASFTDVGTLDTHVVSVDWGDGSPNGTSLTDSHQYLDDDPTATPTDTYTVTVTVTDDDGGVGSDTLTVTVNNVDPVVEAGDDQTINENDSITLAASFTDPGTLDTHVVSVDWGDGSPNGTSLTDSHQYLDDDPTATPSDTYTVTVTVTDDDGGVGSDTLTVTVNNVDPVVEAGGDQTINENDSITLAASFTDVGTLDTHVVSVDWGDGSPNGTSLTDSHQYLDDDPTATPTDTYTVTVTVTDDDGGVGSDTLTVTVNNVDPVVEAGGDQTINENDSITLAASFTDVGTLDTHVVSVDWGDGSPNGTSLTDSHQYLDDDPTATPSDTYTVTVTVTDDDGGVGSDTLTVTVNNVDPVVEAGDDQTINENDSITLAASFTDVGTLDTHDVSVDWGDGSPNGTSLTDSHQYLDDDPTATPTDTYTVTVTVTDDDTGVGSDTLTVTVNNVDPVVEAGGDQTINENDSITLAASFTDVGTLDTHVVSVDWGDGSPNGSSLTDSHQYLDDDPTATPTDTYTVTVTVTDDDGGVGSDTLTVTVNNIAPELGDITVDIDLIEVGTEIAASASFTDTGTLDTHAAVWDWGDGTSSGTVTQGFGSGSVEDVHTYNEAGVYTIELTVTDDDTGVDVVVYQYVVVYDPGAGFVTGGGWINSPAGAYVPDPELTGRANFGFVSKYKKGRTVPEGSTEFQFKAGDINFHSNDYEWLVVTHHKATFKGVGTINGDGNFGFMLKSIDAKLTPSTDVDLFSIKIWDIANGDAVVYDNGLGADTDADPAQEIDGGQIVIHTKK